MKTKDKLDEIYLNIKGLIELSKELDSNFTGLSEICTEIDLKCKYDELTINYKNLSDIKNSLESELMQKNHEINELKHTMIEIVNEEKRRIVEIEKNKVEKHLSFKTNSIGAKLNKIKNNLLNKIANMEHKLLNDIDEKQDDLINEINKLKIEVDSFVLEAFKKEDTQSKDIQQEINQLYEELEKEPLSEKEVNSRVKESKFELTLGLNWINKIGILLIIFGVVGAFKYSYTTWFNDYAKGCLFFLLGGIFLASGEYFNRKNKIIFSRGLTGGGIGILYSSAFFCHFLLNIISFPIMIFLSILITITSIYLSIRYDSRTIAIISLIGGYLSVITYIKIYSVTKIVLLLISAYVLILNSLLLGISIKKDWKIVTILSNLLHLPYLIYITFDPNICWFNLLYVNLIFVIHLFSILIYPIKFSKSLKRIDRIIIAINTLISFVFSYFIFKTLNILDFIGILCVAYGIVYFYIAKCFKKNKEIDEKESSIFYSIVLLFSCLIVPMQFGMKWLVLGWILQGMSLIYVSTLKNEKGLFRSGSVILFLGQAYFFINEIFIKAGYLAQLDYSLKDNLLYLLIIIISIGYFYIAKSKYKITKLWEKRVLEIYKILVVIVCTIYIFYLGNVLEYKIDSIYKNIGIKDLFIILFLYIYSYILQERKELNPKFTKPYGLFLNILGMAMTLIINAQQLNETTEISFLIKMVFYIILAMYNIFAALSLKTFVKLLAYKQLRNIEVYPILYNLVISAYLVSYLTFQLNLEIPVFYLNLIIMCGAVINIFIGFKYYYRYLRYVSLAFIILIITKTFFMDMSYINQGIKIISYFVYGGLLIGISYLYQHLSERFQVKFESEN